MRRSPIAKRGKAGESLKVGGVGGRRGGTKPRKQNIDDEEEEDMMDHESPLPPLQGCPSTGRWLSSSDHQHLCDFLPGRAFSQQKEERHILGLWWRNLQFYMLSPEGWRRSNTHLIMQSLLLGSDQRQDKTWLTFKLERDLKKQGPPLCFCPKVSWSCPCTKLSWRQAATFSGYPGWSS